MTVETATHVNDLNVAYPAAGDGKDEGDDQLRLIKTCVKASVPEDFRYFSAAAGGDHPFGFTPQYAVLAYSNISQAHPFRRRMANTLMYASYGPASFTDGLFAQYTITDPNTVTLGWAGNTSYANHDGLGIVYNDLLNFVVADSEEPVYDIPRGYWVNVLATVLFTGSPGNSLADFTVRMHQSSDDAVVNTTTKTCLSHGLLGTMTMNYMFFLPEPSADTYYFKWSISELNNLSGDPLSSSSSAISTLRAMITPVL